MKKTKSLTILLNVFAVLSLAYTCYAAIKPIIRLFHITVQILMY